MATKQQEPELPVTPKPIEFTLNAEEASIIWNLVQQATVKVSDINRVTSALIKYQTLMQRLSGK